MGANGDVTVVVLPGGVRESPARRPPCRRTTASACRYSTRRCGPSDDRRHSRGEDEVPSARFAFSRRSITPARSGEPARALWLAPERSPNAHILFSDAVKIERASSPAQSCSTRRFDAQRLSAAVRQTLPWTPVAMTRWTSSAFFAGRYTVDRQIGTGGMATVYLARDETRPPRRAQGAEAGARALLVRSDSSPRSRRPTASDLPRCSTAGSGRSSTSCPTSRASRSARARARETAPGD